MPRPTTTLILTTYNWPEALRLCLLSIERQSVLPDEVIVADDGSGPATAELVQRFQRNFPVPLRHVWQPDEGFQLAKIRNRAIAAAQGEYIIQIDGDLLLHRRFVEDHLRVQRPGAYVCGSRVSMDAALSKRLLGQAQPSCPSPWHKGLRGRENGVRLPLLRELLASRYKADQPIHLRGCNMAYWRQDLIRVNGYNEGCVGWGKEDSELSVRLSNAGIKKRALKFAGTVFHLHHREACKQSEAKQIALLHEAIRLRYTECEVGIRQYL